ncbi:MAG TPA: MarR family EPS-associated transcriptional regulator [Burkholderiaceae bacterium]|nr:MarR family EPS-associated transcriptional regulator [Burkholderiaceae bacterium]
MEYAPDPDSPHLELLRMLEQQPQMTQRELSRALGISLGKTHYVLHALVDRGLVKARNFRRSDNKLAYAYLLTPSGVREKLRMTHQFLSRKEAEFERLQATIRALRAELGATPTRPN